MPSRRHFLATTGALLGSSLTMPWAVAAEAYPSRPIRCIAPLPPGGSIDALARMVGDPLGQRLGQPVIVENRPGAGGNLATGLVARSAADGYTLLITGNNHTINPALFRNAGYEVSDFRAIAALMTGPSVIVVGADTPYRNLQDLLAAARAKPGSISYGSAGNGLPSHVSGELLKQMAQVEMVHVPYKGSGPSLTDALGGQIPVVIASLVAAAPHLKGGRLRAIGVTSEKRWPSLPDVPAVAEVVPGFRHDIWIGLFAPKATPEAIVRRLNHEVTTVITSAAITEKIAELGGSTKGLTDLETFSRFIEQDHAASVRQVAEMKLRTD